jgi:hypothetical protein
MAASNSLAKALVAAQKEMPAVDRDGKNPHFKSDFTTLDHLIAKTKPVLAKHGLAVLQLPADLDGRPALRTVLMHESGETVEDTMPLLLTKQDPQGQGAALTYARRYAWSALLGIATEVDDDGNTASEGGPRAQGAPADPDPAKAGQPSPSEFKAPTGRRLSEKQRKFAFALISEIAPVYDKTPDEMRGLLEASAGTPEEPLKITEWTKAELDRLVRLHENALPKGES